MKTKKLFNSVKAVLAFFLFLNLTCVFAQTYDLKVSTSTNSTIDEGEAQIAINPLDSSKMVIGFMQTSTSGVTFKVYKSSDFGNSWQLSSFNSTLNISSDYPGHVVAGGGDILLTFDKTGNLYCTWIYLLANPSLTNYMDSLVWASYWATSTNNGQSFTLQSGSDHFWGRGKLKYGTQQVVHNYYDGICDRNWLAVDFSNGSNANKLYVGYINYPYNTLNTGLKVKTKAPSATAFSAEVKAYAGNGQLSNLMVDGNGVLHYTFADIMYNKILHVSSSNGAQSFSATHNIANCTSVFPQSTKFLNDRENAAPSLAIDGSNNLHIVWNDFISGTFPKAYYSKSTDGGITWSAPLDLSTKFGNNVFMPTISAKNNRVTISANVLAGDKKSQYYILSSSNFGQNFGFPLKVSNGITDFAAIGKSVFVGDYSTSTRTNCYVFSAWTDARANGRKQYISKVNDCLPFGIQEITPVNSTYYIANLYPVPASSILNLDINSDIEDQITISIVDIQGKIVYSAKNNISAGKSSLSLPVNELANGNYLVKLVNKDNVFLTRMFVKD
ncbi:MAG: T9SS type A sorting domain-containing protein [Bacteroidetes bacterium]|nr:T9SS type A sorting domain-containing protein [Bacteroidota bacterium]